MKKIIVLLMAVVMVLGLVSCADTNTTSTPEATDASGDGDAKWPEAPMTYQEYVDAPINAPVYVETYVQANQLRRENKITLYCQSKDGALFIYELACSEEDAAKLTRGTKIAVKGYKAEFNGEVEIMNATFTFVEGGDTFVAEAFDATSLLGTDDMIKHQNELATFKGMTVNKIEYKNGEPGDDIYLTLDKDGKSYSFCVEVYLTGTDSEVYKTVGTLEAGEVVDVECFLYWYQGMNPHITAITVVTAE